MAEAPLAGIRVLAMEQAVALPVCTRHLADAGAEVIRVQSHARRVPPVTEIDLTRNKRQLALDLNAEGAREAFLRVAAQCDVVAHNYTPRVVRQFGIDYEGVRRVNPEVIYVSLTGFGTTGPWGERPLFGPGAEAVSGHNLLIGEPEGMPGRPGTIVYADTNCGLNAAFAVIAAIEERDRTGRGQHIDVSLYETSVAQLGPVLAEAELGASPGRVGNRDVRFAIHGVFDSQAAERHVALAVRHEQLDLLVDVLGLAQASEQAIASVALSSEAESMVAALQAVGIAASVVADASDTSRDGHLWARNFFGIVERHAAGVTPGRYPHMGPAWGGGPLVNLEEARPVGADSEDVLIRFGGYTREEVADLVERGATAPAVAGDAPARRSPEVEALRVHRGELARIDSDHDGWRQAAEAVR